MKTIQEFIEGIKARKELRSNLLEYLRNPSRVAEFMFYDILDDMLEHRIQSDKVIEGILKDIQGSVAQVTEELMKKPNWKEKNVTSTQRLRAHPRPG